MWIIISVAAGAALAVIVYNRVRERDPDHASASMRRIHQLAAVIVVVTSGIEKTFDALAGTQPTRATYRPRPMWQLEEEDL